MSAPVIPQAVEAEQALLGAMLNSDLACAKAQERLMPRDFYQPRHQTLFAAILAVFDSGVKLDPVVVAKYLTDRAQLNTVGGHPYLHTLFAGVATATNAEHYAQAIKDMSRRRQAMEIGQRIVQMAAPATNEGMEDGLDISLDLIARQLIQLEVLIEERGAEQQIRGRVSTWDEMFQTPDTLQDWLVPELMERQDVFMLLAPEGIGKSWLSRQFAMGLAAGVHPFFPARPIRAVTTLLIDAENAESTLRRQARFMSHQVAEVGVWQADKAHVWTINEGMNLRKPEDARMFENVVAEIRPDLVCLGPLYKLFQRGSSDWDTAASEVREVLDKVRRRYNCALFIEHHMPKPDAHGKRDSPYGSSEWQRWVSHGRVLTQLADLNCFELVPFRLDRDIREIPHGLFRAAGPGSLPWGAIWDMDEMVVRKEQARLREKELAGR